MKINNENEIENEIKSLYINYLSRRLKKYNIDYTALKLDPLVINLVNTGFLIKELEEKISIINLNKAKINSLHSFHSQVSKLIKLTKVIKKFGPEIAYLNKAMKMFYNMSNKLKIDINQLT